MAKGVAVFFFKIFYKKLKIKKLSAIFGSFWIQLVKLLGAKL
jgi:hypothetical protein